MLVRQNKNKIIFNIKIDKGICHFDEIVTRLILYNIECVKNKILGLIRVLINIYNNIIE